MFTEDATGHLASSPRAVSPLIESVSGILDGLRRLWREQLSNLRNFKTCNGDIEIAFDRQQMLEFDGQN